MIAVVWGSICVGESLTVNAVEIKTESEEISSREQMIQSLIEVNIERIADREGAPEQVESSITENEPFTCKVTSGLNVRSGAGTEFEKIGFLNEGDTVIVVMENESWCLIEYNGEDAYVSGDFLERI